MNCELSKVNCELKDLLQELISKNVCLDTAATILWQLKIYEQAKEEERYAKARNAGADAVAYLNRVSDWQRLQLKQYMEDADISQKLIKEFCPATTEK